MSLRSIEQTEKTRKVNIKWFVGSGMLFVCRHC